jgi:O-antigen/teichoic acid export membrane protein
VLKSGPRLLSNLSLSLMVSLISRVTGIVLFFVISRRVTASGVGVYALAMTYVALLLSATSLGHNDPITRDIAKDPDRASIYISHFTVLRVLTGLLSYAVLVVLVTIGFHYPAGTTVVLLVMGLSLIPDGLNQLYRSVFAAFERQSYNSATNATISVVNVALVWLLLRSDANLEVVAWARLIAIVLGLTLNLVLSVRIIPLHWLRTMLRPDWAWISRQLRAYLPFTLMTVLYTIEWRADVLILSVSHSESEIGRYYAAETLLVSFLLLLEAYRLAALPRMSKLLHEDRYQLAHLHDRSLWYLFAAAMPIAVGTSILGPQLLSLLNPGFAAASDMLIILMVALVISFINEPNGLLMIAGGYQRQLAFVFIASLIVNIGSNLLLTPLFGGIGSAIARVLSVGVFSLIAAVLVSSQIRKYWPFRYAVQVVLATCGMGVALWWLQHGLPWWLAAFASVGVYALLLIALRGVPAEDFERLTHLLRSRKNRDAAEIDRGHR